MTDNERRVNAAHDLSRELDKVYDDMAPLFNEIISKQFKWKVIRTDNYDRDTVSDKLMKDNLTEEQAIALAEALNKVAPGDDFYRVVSQDEREP